MRRLVAALAALAAITGIATAQEETHLWQASPEVRAIAGGFLPTGAQRNVVQAAPLLGVQMGYEVARNVTVVGTFAWSPNEYRPLATTPMNVFQYDVGLELARPRRMNDRWAFKPFLGAGVGGINYDFRKISANSHNALAGYGAVGAEFEIYSVALRFEARDYLSDWNGITGTEHSVLRNHLTLMTGFAFHFFH